MAREPMICPVCHIPMNHHADKLVYSEQNDFGNIEEFHACPNCGGTESRSAE
jgi:hypothetical protein